MHLPRLNAIALAVGCSAELAAACSSDATPPDIDPDSAHAGSPSLGAAHSGSANAARAGNGVTSGGSGGGGGGGGAGGATIPGASVVDCNHDADGKTTLVFFNGCTKNVSFRGSDIAGGTLEPGAFQCVDIGSDVEPLNAKRYWGFSGEDPGAENHTLAEFTFNTDFNHFDWYNISHVDAFNLPLQIAPLSRPKCDVLTCAVDWLPVCPTVGRFADASGKVIACVSPERNNPDSPVARLFESCDEGYAWSGDDQKGDDPSPVRACAGEDWTIVFCPEAQP